MNANLKKEIKDLKARRHKKEKEKLDKQVEVIIRHILIYLEEKVENQEKAEYIFSDRIITEKTICYDDKKLERIKRILKKKLKKAGLRVNIEKKKELISVLDDGCYQACYFPTNIITIPMIAKMMPIIQNLIVTL